MSMEELKEQREARKKEKELRDEAREMKKEANAFKSKLLGLIRGVLKFVERHLVLTIVIVLFFAFGVYKIGSFVFYKKVGETRIETSMKGYKRIDSLFTAFAYIPIMDFKDKNQIFSQDPNLSSGYCLRRYEVGMGYKDIFEIYKANKDAICKDKNPSALPFPIPLSVNPVSSEIYGSYTQQECDSFDRADSSGYTKNKGKIAMYIKDKYGEEFYQRSKEMLFVFLSGYCDLESDR